MSAAEIWSKLSAINVQDKVEKKGGLTFLSWAWAWGRLMENYPDADYEFSDNEYHPDESVTVHCTLTIEGITRPMWLPVMDNRNKSVIKPTSREISDARMRCLVKCIAMFGLGHYIYAGEDLPETKPDYSQSDFNRQKEDMKKAIDSGEKTTPAIISNIRKTRTVSPEMAQQITNLGNGTEETPEH